MTLLVTRCIAYLGFHVTSRVLVGFNSKSRHSRTSELNVLLTVCFWPCFWLKIQAISSDLLTPVQHKQQYSQG